MLLVTSRASLASPASPASPATLSMALQGYQARRQGLVVASLGRFFFFRDVRSIALHMALEQWSEVIKTHGLIFNIPDAAATNKDFDWCQL